MSLTIDRSGAWTVEEGVPGWRLRQAEKGIALIIGTEAIVVFKYVLKVDEAEAREVTR